MGKKKNTGKSSDKHRISRVLWVFYCLFLIASVAIIIQIRDIQTDWKPNEHNIGEFTSKTEKRVIEPERGSIYDCKGRLLATSTPMYTIRMDTQILMDKFGKEVVKVGKDTLTESSWRDLAYQTCMQLPEILNDGRSGKALYDTLISYRDSRRKGRRDVLFISDIDHATLQKIEQLPLFRHKKYISGMKLKKENARMYPYNELGRRVIGDVRIDPKDTARNRFIGIEGQYDYVLHGTEGYRWMKETDKGDILHPDSTIVDAIDGRDIVTTIDIDIQDIADRAIRKHIADDPDITDACVIIMDVKSGAVKAMANLSKTSKGDLKEIFNLAIGRPSEPGSIFKTITLTTLLEDGYATLDTEVKTNGGYLEGYGNEIFDKTLYRYESTTGKKSITVREGFKRSSNNVFKSLVLKHYGEKENRNKFTDRLFEYKLQDGYTFDIKDEGYGESTLRESWSKADLHSTAIGYSIKQTPLNILMFYNAVANGGKMMKPYLIDSYLKDGSVEEKFTPQILNGAICSKSTCDTLTAAMKKVTSEGTAKRLKNAKCQVAGKTGTANVRITKMENPHPEDRYKTIKGERKQVASFVGYFPADNPRYSAIVTIYTRLTVDHQNYAGGKQPTLILADIVNYLWGLDTDWGTPIGARAKVPTMKADFIGTRKGSGLVPNVNGMGLKDAIYALENNGYNVEYKGIGHVAEQSPKAGERLDRGNTVKIVLK